MIAAYAATWRSPFLLDDYPSIVENASIRSGPFSAEAFSPPPWSFTAGRPLLNWSFAVDYSLIGGDPVGYRLGNLLIHTANGALAFWLILEFLTLMGFGSATGRGVAAGTVALWLLNPVNTVCVSYISQRAESLMALFYLTTLGCMLRGERSAYPALWGVGSGLAFCFGLLTKETAISAPLVIAFLLWAVRWSDRRPGWSLLLSVSAFLAPGLLLFVLLSVGSGLFSRGGITNLDWSVSDYLVIQVRGWGEYVRLAIFPVHLIFDRGTTEAALSRYSLGVGFLGITALLISTVGFLRKRLAGLPGGLFLVLLLPTASFLPVIGSPIAENRLYLPLLCSCAATSALIIRLVPQLFSPALICLCMVFCLLSYQRNLDFTSAERLWRDTVEKAPLNHRAQGSLGVALMSKPGGQTEALERLKESVRLEPREGETHYQLGVVSLAMRAPGDAEQFLRECIRLQPSHAMAHAQLGLLLLRSGKVDESALLVRRAVELRPDRVDFRIALGAVLYSRDDTVAEAVVCLESAVKMNPGNHEAWLHLGVALAKDPQRLANAIGALERSVQLNPVSTDGWTRLGKLLERVPGREAEARACIQRASALSFPAGPR